MAEVDPAILERQRQCLHNTDRPDWMAARSKNETPICLFCGETKTAMEKRKPVASFGPFGMFPRP